MELITVFLFLEERKVLISEFNIEILALLFFIVALFYSIVGFGGGSSYSALLLFFAIPYTVAPSISLICNIIVVVGGVLYFHKYGHLKAKLFLPFICLSVPFSFYGGSIFITKFYFQLVLGLCLLASALKMLFFNYDAGFSSESINTPNFIVATLIGAFLGFISGLVGIGGGIFLAPIMYSFHWGRPKEIAGTTAMFILVNSIAGLSGQLQKSIEYNNVFIFIPLFLAVLLGGQVGALIANIKISQKIIKQTTAILILLISSRILISIT
jgi:uncharacterized membrane protein YfcA